jgi:hypothetical protein
MGRILLAFRCFFGILLHGTLSDEAITTLGLSRPAPARPAPPPAPAARPEDGAVEILSILQRDSRLIDFLMEDIAGYDDEQVGAAVRTLHDQCRDALGRYMQLAPIIDGVEGTFTNVPKAAQNPALVKFIGNVPAQPPQAGTLRHKGWRAEKIELPPLAGRQDSRVVAPAEIEIE